ncbi:MAG: hypothetical protein FGM15_10640 [Chthoniobacterales bacterium]|nr:hypothetical protein [Chthoniobacterales bacterium]
MLRSRAGKFAFIALVSLLFAAVALPLAGRHLILPALADWVAGKEFHRILSGAVSSALKVDGKFGKLQLEEGFSVRTDGFTSTGWPGQAIGALDTGPATGRFDPRGILRGAWQVDLISVANAKFVLRTPDDALKALDPQPGPKPWYAALMPSQFHCGWIECPDMKIELPVGQTRITGERIHVGATMIGKNFKYFGKNGALRYPGFPDLDVDSLEVYVTREAIEVGYLYLRVPGSARSNIRLSGRLGQHADKSIAAQADITDLNIGMLLPTEISEVMSGRLSGKLSYDTDTTGGNTHSTGKLSVTGAKLHDWSYLDNLAERADDPALRHFEFDNVSLDYELADGIAAVKNLLVRGANGFALHGRATWNIATRDATASVAVSRIPLSAYLPSSLAGGVNGELSAQADWAWHGTKLGHGRGGGTVSVDGGQLDGFAFQKFLARFLKDETYLDLDLTKAQCAWKQDREGLCIEKLDVLSAGRAGLRGSVRVTTDGRLSGALLVGLPVESLAWLPDATSTVFSKQEDGLYWCSVAITGTEEKPVTDFTAQVLRQLEKHPAAMAELAVRGLSWWLGDVFETRAAREPDRKRNPRERIQ